MSVKEEGLRFNEGKPRYDIVHPIALEGLVKVLTFGAEKYDKSYNERNWEKGMAWSKVIASLKRHLAAIEKGEDYDQETKELHANHLQANAHFLSAYYSIYPQGDDRHHAYLNYPKIGLDIDGVLADWIGAYKEKYNYSQDHDFASWYLHYDIIDKCINELDNDHYLKLKPLIQAKDLPFEPHCYITARHHSREETTKKWLYNNGFPCVPVYLTDPTHNKIEIAKASGIEVFVDDVYKNFVELNNAGICTYLLTTSYNKRYNVGHKRIDSLKDLPWFK